jgi:hypothetical protein
VTDEQIKKAAVDGIPLSHEKEMKLANFLLHFPGTIVRLTIDLCLHPFCE